MRRTRPTARDLSIQVQLRASSAIGPWKLSADDAQWTQAGKWSHAVAIGLLGAWFLAVAALTGGPVNAAMPESAAAERPAIEATANVPPPPAPVAQLAAGGLEAGL